MYNNIGKKIKALAKAAFVVEAIAAVIAGIILLIETEEWLYLLIVVLGPVVAWISSWLLYGFGEIIDKLCDIERNTRGGECEIPKISSSRRDTPSAVKGGTQATKGGKRSVKSVSTTDSTPTKVHDTIAETESESALLDSDEATIRDIEYIDVFCPGCGEALSFDKTIKKAECPYCGFNVPIRK